MNTLWTTVRGRIVSMLLVFLLVLFALLTWDTLRERAEARQEVERDTVTLARALVHEQEELLDGTRRLLAALARLPAARSGDPDACAAELGALRDQYETYLNFLVADADGTMWCLTQPFDPPVSVADRAYFTRAMQQRQDAVTPYALGRVTGRPLMIIGHPLLDERSEPQGVVAAQLDLAWLGRTLDQNHLPEGVIVRLTNAEGTVLARHPDPESWIGETLDTETHPLSTDADGYTLFRTTSLEGESTLFTSVPLGQRLPDIHLTVGVPTAVAFAGVQRAFWRDLGIVTVLTLTVLLLFLIGADRLVFSRLTQLTAISQRLARGELDARSGLGVSPDEFGQLGASFDHMADALRAREQEQERIASTLAEQKDRYRLLADNTVDVVAMHDRDGRYTYVSPSVRTVLGFEPSELLGTDPYELVHSDDTERVRRDSHEQALRGTYPVHVEYRIRRKTGEHIWFETTTSPELDERGEIVGLQTSSRDIGDRVLAEKQRLQYTTQLERSNRELQEFAYVASHDLQEPLRKIQAFGDRLANRAGDELDERSRDYLERMQGAAGRMRILIEDLLSFSRVSTQARPYEPVDLGAVLEQVVEDFSLTLRDTDGQIEVLTLPRIEADPVQMRQLFANLVSNALKYRRSDVPPRLVVRSRLERDAEDRPRAVIEVEDNGIGFEAQHHDKMFSMFQRLHGRGVYEGTGVGLAVCRKIVERHQGDIHARSTPGEGSTFVVSLPVDQETEGVKA